MTVLMTLFGGLGLFLLGLHLMTDGLKAAAGEALAGYLARFTGGRASAVFTGAALTAVVQSSSATTLASIGFVSAGLLSFNQALGVVIGANVGTTSTGWLVSLLGFKVSIAAFALPLVGTGALLRLLGRGRVPMIGLALAGFGLVFVGIQVLQEGMAGAAGHLDLARFGTAGLLDRLLLVGVGLVTTVLMQSSSAAVATTLAALAAGGIDLHQAAALVVGQNVGTTVTAGLAAIGASTAAKRTSLAHVLFNGAAALVAFLALPLFVAAVVRFNDLMGLDDAPLQLAMFHTAFNLLGALLILPVLDPFARVVERWIPETGNPLTRYLDDSLLQTPALALATCGTTLRGIGMELFRRAAKLLRFDVPDPATEAAVRDALLATQRFLTRAAQAPDPGWDAERQTSTLLAIEHLSRMQDLLGRVPPHARRRTYESLFFESAAALEQAADWLDEQQRAMALPTLVEAVKLLEQQYRQRRRHLVEQPPDGEDPVSDLIALRWLDHLLHHFRRALKQLDQLELSDRRNPPEPELPPPLDAPGDHDNRQDRGLSEIHG